MIIVEIFVGTSEIKRCDFREVDLDKNQVRVDYDENRVSVEQMKEAIEDQGYDVK